MEPGKPYNDYSIEDFILDEHFQDWVMRGRDGQFWLALMAGNPERAERMRVAREFILSLSLKEEERDQEREKRSLEGFLHKLEEERLKRRGALEARRRRHTFFVRVAASALILGLFAGSWHMLNKKKPVLVRTEYGQMKKILLPDNSLVYLNANSSLRYEKSMLGAFPREVWLEGEAFFEVKKQRGRSGTDRHFLVHAKGMGVKVLGTRFNVRQRRSEGSVTLQSGKVEVNLEKGRKLTLQPGERVEFNQEEKKVVRNKVEPERYTSWTDLHYTFDQTPARELIPLMADNYGLEVVFADKRIAESRLSGILEADNLQTFMNAVAFALNVNISKEGNQLIFEPKR